MVSRKDSTSQYDDNIEQIETCWWRVDVAWSSTKEMLQIDTIQSVGVCIHIRRYIRRLGDQWHINEYVQTLRPLLSSFFTLNIQWMFVLDTFHYVLPP